jgi:hypothetical protein
VYPPVSLQVRKIGEKNGVKTELQTSVKLAESLRLSTSAAHFSPGYRELTDALNDDFQPYTSTYSTSLAWFTPLAGHLAQVLTTAKEAVIRVICFSSGAKALNMPPFQLTGRERWGARMMTRSTLT